MRRKGLKLVIIPIILFIIILLSNILFFYFSKYLYLTETGKRIFAYILGVFFIFITFILVYGIFTFLKLKLKNQYDTYLIKNELFNDFYELLYRYCEEKNLSSEILKQIKKDFTRLSFYLSDKTIKFFNKFFKQTQDYIMDNSLEKKELKQKRITFEECVLMLREELGVNPKRKSSVKNVNNTRKIFTKLEMDWFEWTKSRVWFFETCRDYGSASLNYMKNHNLIFLGGGSKGHYSNIVKQIKKDDIILAHKFDEGYVAIGIVTVDTKSIIWPKDNPLMYLDGEIRIPVRWLLFLNVGVNGGYIPEGVVTQIKDVKKAYHVIVSLQARALEAGNQFEKEEIRKIIDNLKSVINLTKPKIEID